MRPSEKHRRYWEGIVPESRLMHSSPPNSGLSINAYRVVHLRALVWSAAKFKPDLTSFQIINGIITVILPSHGYSPAARDLISKLKDSRLAGPHLSSKNPRTPRDPTVHVRAIASATLLR